MDTEPTTPEGPLDDAQGSAAPLAAEPVLQSEPSDAEPIRSPQTVTIEVALPPLPPPEAPEEELAIRLDDVPVDATMVDVAAIRTASIELPPGLGAVDVSVLLSRSTGPQLRVPPGLRTTGPTPRITPAVPSTPRPTTGAVDALLTGGPVLFGGHVPGATGEVPRLEASVAGRGERRSSGSDRAGASATSDLTPEAEAGRAGSIRGVQRARKLVARLVDGRPARRAG